jgi:hypothetical protein
VSGVQAPTAGAALYPPTDPAFGDLAGPGRPAQLARLPRRRRPGMIALAIALVCAGILASVALYSAANHRVPVLVVTANVPAGARIGAADIAVASILPGAGVDVIPAGQLRQVVGQVAGSALHPGMLLAVSELATAQPPGPGQVLVPLPMRPSLLPASGLGPGDRVLIVATPGAQGQAGTSAAAPAMASPVAGVVEAVSAGPDADGYQVVDLLVAAARGAALAEQASTGQISLIVTRRAA